MQKITAKQCFKCKKTKAISGFYRHSQMADGTLGKCKECTKKDANAHRNANLDKIRAYDRARALLPHRKKETLRITEEYRKKFPHRSLAVGRVSRALKSGKLKRPNKCALCKKKKKVLAHHDDYSKPLEVVWVCQPCHKQIHKEWREPNI